MLNNPLEFEYGKRLIEERIDYFIKKEEDERIKEALKDIKKFPSYVKNTHKIFVASFCEDDNLLSQWKGYAEGGVGYNLGFIFNSGTKYFISKNLPEPEINLRKVIYKRVDQINLIDVYISNIIDGLKQSLSEKSHYKINNLKYDIAPISVLTSNLFIDMMLSMKNEKFYEENEWRLLRVIGDSETPAMAKFRLVNNELVPFLDTNIFYLREKEKIFPLEFIKIGPMLEEDKNKPVISMFIKSEQIKVKEIKLNTTNIKHAGYTLRR